MEALNVPADAKDFQARSSGVVTPRRPRVGISSDDGPNIDNLENVLGILKDHGTTATFFWIVGYAKRFQEKEGVVFGRLLHQLRDDGHEIALHAPDDYKPTLRKRLISAFSREELQTALEDLRGVTDMEIQYFFPHLLPQVLSVVHARQLGLKTPLRDVIHYADAASPVERQVEKFSGAWSGNTIVFHDGISELRQETHIVEVLPEVLTNLEKKGQRPVKISELSRIPAF